MAGLSTPCIQIIRPWVGVIEHLFLNLGIFTGKLFRKKNKINRRCPYSQPTGAANFDPDDILVTSSQTSRESLLSFDKFRYLDVPKLDEIMVYDDFECIFKCLHHPLCVSVNLVAEGDLWCELLSSEKYSILIEYKEKKSSQHFFFEVRTNFLWSTQNYILIASLKLYCFRNDFRKQQGNAVAVRTI